jgi:hypothetical protein
MRLIEGKEAKMISMEQYEQAEREVVLAEWRHRWRVHAVWFLIGNALLALSSIRFSAGYWFVFALVGWSVVLLAHYVLAVGRGEVRLREQQIRVAWRAGEGARRLVAD